MLLATGAFFLVQLLTTDKQFANFGWRIPFIASAVLVARGLWIRLGVTAAPEFHELKDAGNVADKPVWTVVTQHQRALLVTSCMRLAQTSIYYLITVYMLSYLIAQRGDDSAGVIAVMIASAVSLFSGPAWGWLSDKVGRRPVTVFGCVATAVFGWIFFAYLDAGPLVFL